MRDKLIELILNADTYDSYECKLCVDDDCEFCQAEKLADYLIAHGVVVPGERWDKMIGLAKEGDSSAD